jgi:hypothetical protein
VIVGGGGGGGGIGVVVVALAGHVVMHSPDLHSGLPVTLSDDPEQLHSPGRQ